MDLGASVAWPERFNPDELSAVQHAMNLKLENESSFMAEYQNQPLVETGVVGDLVTAEQICQRINRHERGVAPLGTTHLSAFIDVHQNLLFWMICAWESNFTGSIIEYGAYPDPQRPYFTLRDVGRTLSNVVPNSGLEGAIYTGLERLTEKLLGQPWQRDGGTPLFVEKCLIDANWGQSTEVVYRVCRHRTHPTIVMPSHGRFVGASSKPFSEYEQRPGEKAGWNWRIPAGNAHRPVRHVIFDANFWKSFIQARLVTTIGDHGCLTLFGDDPTRHRLLADHLTGEYRVQTTGRGRTVDEWKARPEQPDNHFLDCLVGSAVGASMLGCDLIRLKNIETKKVSFSEMLRAKRANRHF